LGYLEDFLFPPHRARVKVGSLSGGERARLLLAKLFTKPANMLILDEPTNDLDLETLELLEELIQNYKGTVLLVSHDRSFVDNVVTQSLAFVGDGRIVEVAGGYEDWAMIKHQYVAEPQVAAESLKPVKAVDSVPLGVSQQSVKKQKLSYKEQKQLDTLPETIATLEAEQASLGEQLSDSAIFADSSKVQAIQQRLQQLEQEIEAAMTAWAELEAKQA
jgi:ATP-binding cassette subfamily F protein uup